MKNFVIGITALMAMSCSNNTEQQAEGANHTPDAKAVELNNQAMELDKSDAANVDSAIALLDQATAVDSLYLLAYVNKVPLLMDKKDFPRLLETNENIRKLSPNQPTWIMQNGVILELSGDTEAANKVYKEGIASYEDILASNPEAHWGFKLEFAQSLVLIGEYDKAQKMVEDLKKESPDLEIWETFQLKTKDEIFEFMKSTQNNR